ncbi:MAG: hypothetical protein HGB14_12975, partial [Anaerolineaceae bacterium]|nr:hypothetical protein [Anaerolineaceae bacterium]
ENDEAKELISISTANQECLFPYLNGQDINSSLTQSPTRWVIDFGNREFNNAQNYPDLLKILEKRVKPERMKLRTDISTYERMRKYWWQHQEFAVKLKETIRPLTKFLTRSRVSELHMLTFASKEWFCGDATAIFAFDTFSQFAILQSSLHEVWLRRQASTMRTDIRYTPSDCFQTFPFPQGSLADKIVDAEMTGQAFYEHRQQTMVTYQFGLTKLYNIFNNQACQDNDIIEMRRLHSAMNQSVLACYGWQDIDLQHDFYPNDRKKIRFTPAPEAQREIFIRLMDLNQKIAAEEAAKGITPDLNIEDEEEA